MGMLRHRFPGVVVLLLAAVVPSPALAAGRSAGEGMVYLDNGRIRIGVDLDRGGSIAYLADVQRSASLVNVHDRGRYIGQSYYAGPQPFGRPDPAWKNWPWNPVSAGDVHGNGSRVLSQRKEGGTLYVRSVPLQWALDGVAAECTFETWITLDGKAAWVRSRLTNRRADTRQHPALDQELPAVYTIGTLHRLMTYEGPRPFQGDPVREVPKKPTGKDGHPEWTSFTASEHWAALVNESDWGLGVFHPGVLRFLGGFSGKPNHGGPEDDPTGYIAPLRREILDHNIVYEYRYALVVDNLANIRRFARDHRPASSLPDFRYDSDRQHWWLLNAEDAGYPISGKLHIKLEKDDPQLLGPEALWDARDVPRIHLRAAFQTRQQEADLYWSTWDRPSFHPEQRMRLKIQPDGRLHTYTFELAQSPAYRGTITGLRLDPIDGGAKGDWVEIVFLSHRKE